jgi:hypothetical protein
LGQITRSMIGEGESPLYLELGGLPAGLYQVLYRSEDRFSTATLSVSH